MKATPEDVAKCDRGSHDKTAFFFASMKATPEDVAKKTYDTLARLGLTPPQ